MPMVFQTEAYLSQIQARVAKQLSALARYIAEEAVEIHGEIQERTPVDTGALRASWQVTQVGPYAWRISTHLPYAVAVEYGLYKGLGPRTLETGYGRFSKQAPQGVVRITLLTHQKDFVQGALRAMRDAA